MLEAEIAFSEDIEDPMVLAETLCRETAQKFLGSCQSDLDYIKKYSPGNLIVTKINIMICAYFTLLLCFFRSDSNKLLRGHHFPE
jgi:aspartyl/asparaginyl-tRNA synthetase